MLSFVLLEAASSRCYVGTGQERYLFTNRDRYRLNAQESIDHSVVIFLSIPVTPKAFPRFILPKCKPVSERLLLIE